MSFEYKQVNAKDYGIKERDYEDWNVEITYKRPVGSQSEEDWEIDHKDFISQIVKDTTETLRTEIEDLKSRITILEGK